MSHFRLTTCQVPTGQAWLVGTILGSDNLNTFLKEKIRNPGEKSNDGKT